MTTTQRVAPLPPEERDVRPADLVRRAGQEYGVYTTLVRHTDLFADFLPLGRRLLRRSSLVPRDRTRLPVRAVGRTLIPEPDEPALPAEAFGPAPGRGRLNAPGYVDTPVGRAVSVG